jgi:MoaA/NifB/PqqE/SkfB family radical SAM enzyme
MTQTSNITAILSMLHEPPLHNSATRLFRQQPVLAWTLERLQLSGGIGSIGIICWQDQLEHVVPVANEFEAHVLSKDPRVTIPAVDAVTAARKWADGWRGGLMYACDFDLGFYAPWVKEMLVELQSDAVVLVDPSAGLIDPKIVDDLIARAEERPQLDLCFTQAAPGLGGVLLRPAFLERLASARTHPGRLLNYMADQPMRDPISGDACVAVPTCVARTTENFRLDSPRRIRRFTDAAVQLNGELFRSDAEDLVKRLQWSDDVDPLPREVVIELNTNRATSPIYWPGRSQMIVRDPITLELAERIFRELAVAEDVRVNLAGVGDPLLHDHFTEIVSIARKAGVNTIHVETDLPSINDETIERLVDDSIDLISIHLPAVSQTLYSEIMGVDDYVGVLDRLKQLVVWRQKKNRGTPLIVPTFIKLEQNIAEMEAWYDQWLKALGCAVLRGPGNCDAEGSLLDMSPPKRGGCRRIASRLTILSNGKATTCEQDALGRQIVGDVSESSIHDIWQDRMKPIRDAHDEKRWHSLPVCNGCREWHRP